MNEIPAEAKLRMEQLFTSLLGSNKHLPAPSPAQMSELRQQYAITNQQINAWFLQKRKIHSRSQKKKPKVEHVLASCHPYPEGFKFKVTNLPPQITCPPPKLSIKTRQSALSFKSQQCSCWASGQPCVSGFADLKEKTSNCFQAHVIESTTIHVVECTFKNCSSGNQDCGNRWRPTLTQWHMHKTVVVSDQYEGRGIVMKGLKVREGETIPAWGVIGEYTGAIVNKKNWNENSLYIFEVPKSICIDAEKEGNATRFINHACTHPNACFICVRTEGHDTVYVRAIKEIKGGQFISIDYGRNFKCNPCLCDDCWNSKKKAVAKKN
jgi:hypothetical protein